MLKQNYLRRQLEEDDIPLCQYVILPPQHQWKPSTRQQFPRFRLNPTSCFPTMIITQPQLQPQVQVQQQYIIKRPSYPTTPSSLLDTFLDEDEDEDDEDLVPIAVLQNPIRNQRQFQSAAEKYKEKVKAQLH
jgi:hypothetical protein